MKQTDKEIKDLITSVGSETFIKYYRLYEKHKKSPKNDALRLAYKENGEAWASSSINTKASAGKMIFVKGYEQEVLYRIINNSVKLSQDVIDKAKEYLIPIITSEIETIENILPVNVQTEKEYLIKLRIQQSVYRKMIINHWETCAITNSGNLSILIASHIKPWRDSTNFEKLDPYNGLLLSPLYDKLFDKYLISFNEKGHILISAKISEEDMIAFNLKISDKLNTDKLDKGHIYYLAYHREIFYLKEADLK